MEEINELIRRYGLEEDGEHVIIPFIGKDGKVKRCFVLKRNYIRITYLEDHYIDYPLADVIEAIVRNPELPLSEALYMLYSEIDTRKDEEPEGEKNNGET